MTAGGTGTAGDPLRELRDGTAREKLRLIIERSMMGPSAQALSEDERVLRSSLVAAQLMGLAFMRFIWKIEPLASMDDDAIVAAIAPAIQRFLDGDVEVTTSAPRPTAARRRASGRPNPAEP